MSFEFAHFPYGSNIGSGDFSFRHYGEEQAGINYLCFTAGEAGSTVAMEAVREAPTVSLEYSTDKKTWSTFTVGTTTITLANIGDKVYLRGIGNTTFGSSDSDYNKFVMTGKIAASGSINSLLSYTEEITILTADYCYECMFYDCTSLTTVPELPATTLSESCYEYMFSGCTGLTTAPELPATTLATYCYSDMFSGCTGLTTAPELPATTLAYACYEYMFEGCTGLTTAPELPATTLADACYAYMFQVCTSLTTAPELPATTLADFCYAYMFEDCTSLNYIKVYFTAWGTQTNGWVSSVSSTGTFVCPSTLSTQFGNSKIPTGWTVETF